MSDGDGSPPRTWQDEGMDAPVSTDADPRPSYAPVIDAPPAYVHAPAGPTGETVFFAI
jgi:hypothetical protein